MGYVEYDDWIEFYNGGTEPVDIGGLFVSDLIGDPEPFRISTEYPDSTTIDPGQFLLIWADDSTEQGVLHTNFKLSREGEQVVAYGYDSKAIIDSISYEKVPRNFTFGRLSDGDFIWRELFQPTPKCSNLFTGVEETSFVTSGFQYNAYPNPSSTHTVFQVQLTQDTELTIKVYSVAGELVAIPEAKEYQAGSYELYWDLKGADGNRVAGGLYFFSIETKKVSVQDKLIILPE